MSKKVKSVAIFGAGIAGLSAAHEFYKLGYQVSVYELNSDAGGFFRSTRDIINSGMPSEYSWHGLGPWYHNVFDVLKQIPFDEKHSLYEKSLSRPIAFGVVPDNIHKSFNNSHIFKKPKAFRMTTRDKFSMAWGLLKTWTSNERTEQTYSRINAAQFWKSKMSDKGWKTWISTFGPWIGSDYANASVHHVGLFFRKNLMPGNPHLHPADSEGPSWTQGAGSGWLLFRGPSSEWWFDKWVSHLEKNEVKFYWKLPLEKFNHSGNLISSAQLAGGSIVKADVYVLAVTPFAAVDILNRTPELTKEEQLSRFLPLTQDGPHTQVSFRIAFAEPIYLDEDRSGVILTDSEFNLTLFAEEQVWAPDVKLGEGVESLWTGTACVSNAPGRVHKKPLNNCTQEEFIDEIKAQVFECEGLNYMIRQANKNKRLDEFTIVRIEVWHEWMFSVKGIKPVQPKWVTTTQTQPYLPSQKTSIPNLVLAGAHTKTQADVWSIEGAVESGRRAAKAIDSGVKVIDQHKATVLNLLSSLDNRLYRLRLPQLLDVIAITMCTVAGFYAVSFVLKI